MATVIVPPILLVKLFGCPDYVKVPTKVGTQTVFEAHGKRFYVKRLSQRCYMLTNPLNSSRARFADTAKEIGEDIGRVFETGVLPQEKTSIA